MSDVLPISVFILTYNEAGPIQDCLRSLPPVSEVIVVDSLSDDGTPAIAESLGARVIQRPWQGFYPQVRFAEDQCRHDWVLRLDADETVSPELRADLLRVFRSEPSVSGYRMPRRTFLYKRWVPHAGFYPSWHLRLYRRSRGGHVPRKLHQKVKVKGRVGTLRGAIDHWCWVEDLELFDNFMNYARIEAEELCEKGRRVRAHHFLLPFLNFLKRFVIKRGFLDGSLGIVVSARQACEQMIRLMMAWEMQNRKWLETPDRVYLSARPATGDEDARRVDP